MLQITHDALRIDDHETGEDDAPQRSVLGRAASIMNAFNGEDRVLSLNELSRRSNLPKSTAHRFAEQLLDLGWLERELCGYSVGMRLYEVGSLAQRRSKMRDKALPHLQHLASQTGMAVNFAILDGRDVLYLERLPIRSFDLPTRDGGRMPSTCTGLGKALLAFGSPETAQQLIADGLPKFTRSTIDDPVRFEAELDDIRAAGVAYDREESYTGISCVAAPVRGSGRAIAAVSCTTLTSEFDEELATKAVKWTVRAIWNDLFPRPKFAR